MEINDFVIFTPNQQETLWRTLPHEILCRIFTHLTEREDIYHCTFVSKSWREVIHDESIWGRHNLVYRGFDMDYAGYVLNEVGYGIAARMLVGSLFLKRYGGDVGVDEVLGAVITLHLYGKESIAFSVYCDVQMRLIKRKMVARHALLKALWYLLVAGRYKKARDLMGAVSGDHLVHKDFADALYCFLEKDIPDADRSVIASLCVAECTRYLDRRLTITEESTERFGEMNELQILRRLHSCLKSAVLFDPYSPDYLNFINSPPLTSKVIVQSWKALDASYKNNEEYLDSMTFACCVYCYYIMHKGIKLGSRFQEDKNTVLSYIRRTELISKSFQKFENSEHISHLKNVIKQIKKTKNVTSETVKNNLITALVNLISL
eukprot:TRINITY_DN1387_c0_g1_i1.p1 TRINITY_DN1387_c0_g1~~TRINITY_DN1387_c0_g1_i1.p1  ORF type:complete len:390 (-),score=82.97 TRINITY_DN1387_c0_g1_i1:137-1267(-)